MLRRVLSREPCHLPYLSMPYELGIRPLNSGELIVVGLLGCGYTGVDESMHGHELHMFKNSIHDMVRSKARLKGFRLLF
jgi:hypothetical protein